MLCARLSLILSAPAFRKSPLGRKLHRFTRRLVNDTKGALCALGLLLGILQFNPVLRAQSQTPPAGQQDQQKSQVFVGKIVKVSDGRYALLTDEKAGKGVYLDDQDKAKEFEGKNVKVTGVLETAKNLVHVTDIQPA